MLISLHSTAYSPISLTESRQLFLSILTPQTGSVSTCPTMLYIISLEKPKSLKAADVL
ncbi:hypothetical protein IE077_003631 [Cardiosporidium cionae]|uniref:Uncharacterized protein n=1 Tax=Cardiosporidium cionae TaxID=476202 RepID=A0ABQ7J7U0_9APIC|nr:hypothetical protein IE077_003631 [Cardiosporidium cionae]|eukprot:KAF8820057.1 hypothetical protein IE077_003631 [Cardiosporidium cionae]